MYNFSTGELLIKPRVITITSVAEMNTFFTNSSNRFAGLIIRLDIPSPSGSIILPVGSQGIYDYESFEIYRSNVPPSPLISVQSNIDINNSSVKVIGGRNSDPTQGNPVDNSVQMYEYSYAKYTYMNPHWFVVCANVT